MTVLILGNHSQYFWKGSSTLEYQKALSEFLPIEGSLDVHLFYPNARRHIFAYLFQRVISEKRGNYTLVTGGLIPLLVRYCRRSNVVVHCAIIRSYMVLMSSVCRLFGIPVIVTLHDTLFLQIPDVSTASKVKRKLLRLSNACFVQNVKDRDLVARSFPPDDIYTMKLGIRENASLPLSVPSNGKILFAGGLGNENKGLSFLESSLMKVTEPFELIVCGHSIGQQFHDRYIGTLSRRDYHIILQQVRIVVVPSRYESYSMVALEAVATGIPTIVTETSGFSQYLTDGVDSFIVRYGDEKKVADTITRLLRDDDLWQQISNNAVHTSKKFHWEQIILEYQTAYHNIFQKRN